jgi:transposase
MQRNRSYRYELKPNVSQKIFLAKHAGAARFAYNWGLALRIEMYEKERNRQLVYESRVVEARINEWYICP